VSSNLYLCLRIPVAQKPCDDVSCDDVRAVVSGQNLFSSADDRAMPLVTEIEIMFSLDEIRPSPSRLLAISNLRQLDKSAKPSGPESKYASS